MAKILHKCILSILVVYNLFYWQTSRYWLCYATWSRANRVKYCLSSTCIFNRKLNLSYYVFLRKQGGNVWFGVTTSILCSYLIIKVCCIHTENKTRVPQLLVHVNVHVNIYDGTLHRGNLCKADKQNSQWRICTVLYIVL